MENSSSLPFLIEEKAISQWLSTLDLTKPVQTANKIYATLKTLHKSSNKYLPHLQAILNALTPFTIQLCLNLERLFTSDAQALLDTKKRKIARLSFKSLRYLSFLYFYLSTHRESDQLTLNISRCIQISGLCLKQSALIYERPSEKIWLLIGDIYQQACHKKLLELKINDSIMFFNKHHYILDSIKAILLFNLCKPYYLRQGEISRLNAILEQHTDKLILNSEHSNFCLHNWDCTTTNAVQLITPGINQNLNLLFLDIRLLIPILQSESFDTVANMLKAHLQFITNLEKVPAVKKKIACGFISSLSLIEQHRNTKRINKFPIGLSISDKLELQPLGNEKRIETLPSEDIWGDHESLGILAEEAVIKEVSGSNYSLIELKKFKGQAEDIITIDNDINLQLCIIRHVNHCTNKVQILAEKISSDISDVTLYNQDSERRCIRCHQSNNITLLFVKPNKYTTGQLIKLNHHLYTLSKLFESTAHFMLYQVQPE